jgi:hypothetical protein
MTKYPNWDGLADWVSAELFEAHRGTFRHPELGLVVFGNDGHNDAKGRTEVALFREWLAGNGYREAAFAVDSEGGYTWVMLVTPPEGKPHGADVLGLPGQFHDAYLEQMLWACWAKACGTTEDDPETAGFNVLQQGIARRVLASLSA